MERFFDFQVGDFGKFLATRATGKTIREDLEQHVARDQPDEILIDFAEVIAMTISFADEFIGRLYTLLAAGDIAAETVLLAGLSEENEEAVTVCLQRRDLIAAATKDDHLTLLGAPEYLVETYRCALSLQTFSALDLASHLDVSSQNVNNRLKRLTSAGALHRKRGHSGHGGKEYVYSIPCQLDRCGS